jgi:hypothetical protein
MTLIVRHFIAMVDWRMLVKKNTYSTNLSFA